MSLPLSRLCLSFALAACCLAAHAGSVDDDLRLAARLHKGGETTQAIRLWQAWADRGNADAAYNLAVIHHYGDGVALDYGTAMQWYRIAAAQGDKVSQFQIGLMYQTGQGVAADAAEAHRWFTMHRRHHLHHEHDPQMVSWRRQALALIEDRDRREQAAVSRQSSQQVIAELRQRAQAPTSSGSELLAAGNTGR